MRRNPCIHTNKQLYYYHHGHYLSTFYYYCYGLCGSEGWFNMYRMYIFFGASRVSFDVLCVWAVVVVIVFRKINTTIIYRSSYVFYWRSCCLHSHRTKFTESICLFIIRYLPFFCLSLIFLYAYRKFFFFLSFFFFCQLHTDAPFRYFPSWRGKLSANWIRTHLVIRYLIRYIII